MIGGQNYVSEQQNFTVLKRFEIKIFNFFIIKYITKKLWALLYSLLSSLESILSKSIGFLTTSR